MHIRSVHSIQEISMQYDTGDLPVLVLCSDREQYICKYSRKSYSIAYKLACEYIGSLLAMAWRINTPPFAIVKIMPIHWATISTTHAYDSPAIGMRKLNNVIDITPTSYRQVQSSDHTMYQLLKIALFDFWVANEDRTLNNANLLYDIERNVIISIDYGGIFNNVSFDYKLVNLTDTDSILCADIFRQVAKNVNLRQLNKIVDKLRLDYEKSIIQSREQLALFEFMPKEWAIPQSKIKEKTEELFCQSWVESAWNSFIECLKVNSFYE